MKPGHASDRALVGALQRYVRTELADFKCPQRIEFVATLPRSSTGKVQRQALRGMTIEAENASG